MSEPNLISIIQGRTKGARTSEFVLAAEQFFQRTERSGNEQLQKLELTTPKLLEESERLSQPMREQKDSLLKLRARLSAELSDAIGLEKRGIYNDLEEIKSKLETIQTGLTQAHQPVEKRKSVMEAIREELRNEGKFVQQLLSKFPGAKTIDLQCLVALKDRRGLPALTLIGLNDPRTVITVEPSRSSINSKDGGTTFMLPKDVTAQLSAQIEKATGVKAASLRTDWEEGKIELSTELPTGGSHMIPREAREIIRKAVSLKLFDQVGLLAEVPSWQVKYYGRPSATPKIEGEVIIPPRTRDPLILGIKQFNKGPLAFIVGSFDTTKLEEYAQAEWALAPRGKR